MDVVKFQNESLEAHNKYRALHGAPPLKLNQDICKISQQWANHLSNTNGFEHSHKKGYGENLYMFQSTDQNAVISGKDAVDSWYNEIRDYNFQSGGSSGVTGHFTQVVWKDSTELGVAFAKRGGRIVVVANYTPPGNFKGRFQQNVLPPGTKVSLEPKSSDKQVDSVAGNMKNLSVKDNVSMSSFAKESVEIVNNLRKKHRVGPLELNQEMCKFAANWADECARQKTFVKKPNSPYGSGLYMMSSTDLSFYPTPKEIIEKWYQQSKNFVYQTENVPNTSLNFTQLVWKNTTEFGIAVGSNSEGQHYIVAVYSPRGNYMGEFTANVLPPI